MIPVVVIEAPAPPPAAEQQAALVAACSSALPRGRCRAGLALETVESAQPTDEQTVAVAVLTVRADGSFHIDVALSASRAERWASDEIEFSETDPLIERYRAAGFAIAALAAEAPEFAAASEASPAREDDSQATSRSQEGTDDDPDSGAAEAPNSETPNSPTTGDSSEALSGSQREPSNPADVEGTDPVQADMPRFRAALRPTFGAALDDGSFRAGLAGEAAWRPSGLPVFVGVSAGWSVRPPGSEDLRFDAVSLALLLSYRWLVPRTSLALDAEAGALTERVRVGLDVPDFAGWQQRWMPGVVFGGCATYPARAPLAASACAKALVFDGSTGIEVDGNRTHAVPAGSYRLAVGATVHF